MNEYLSQELIDHIRQGRTMAARAELNEMGHVHALNAMRAAVLDGDVDVVRFLLDHCLPHLSEDHGGYVWNWLLDDEVPELVDLVVEAACGPQGHALRQSTGFVGAWWWLARADRWDDLSRMMGASDDAQLCNALTTGFAREDQAQTIFLDALNGRGEVLTSSALRVMCEWGCDAIDAGYSHCSEEERHKLFQSLMRKSHNFRTGPLNEGQKHFVRLHEASMQRQAIAEQVQVGVDEPMRKIKL